MLIKCYVLWHVSLSHETVYIPPQLCYKAAYFKINPLFVMHVFVSNVSSSRQQDSGNLSVAI